MKILLDIKPLILAVALSALAACAAPARAQDAAPTAAPDGASMEILTLTREQALQGVAVEMDGHPAFIRLEEGALQGDMLSVPVPGAGRNVQVSLLPQPSSSEPELIILPVSIEDKTLARGVTLSLLTPLGNTAKIFIPPRRVFLSIPFTIPVTQEIHKDFGLPGADRLVIQVVPKITKKAQVNIDNTSTDGLVADIRYEGIAYFRLKDLLNRTNRRDMDGTYFIGRSEDARWHIITENLFEKFDRRNIAVMRDQRMSSELKTNWRLDHLENFNALKVGMNLAYAEDDSKLRFGNIDRRVKDRYHFEAGYGDDRLFGLTRIEGLELKNPSGRAGLGLRVDRFGYQLAMSGGKGDTFFEGKFGNLKVQDLDDEGEIDDHFNFFMRWSTYFGRQRGIFTRNNFDYSGQVDLNFYGIGSATWMKGEFNTNITLFRDYLVFFRLNNDFARITGRPYSPVWESSFISFMRNRNYFASSDPLAKLGLESIFVDLRLQREGKGARYEKSVRFGIAKFLKIMNYDIPLELFFETNRVGTYRPGAAISIRSYL